MKGARRESRSRGTVGRGPVPSNGPTCRGLSPGGADRAPRVEAARRRRPASGTTSSRDGLLAAVLLAALALAGCADRQLADADAASFCGEAGTQVEQRITELLGQMSLEEKVVQMHGSALRDGLWGTAGVERLGIPGFRMSDGPRGVGVLTGRATAFPVAAARGASWSPDLETRVGEAIGVELQAKGGNVLLAPTINVLRHPRWGRAQETYGEDPLHLGRMGAAFIRGAQRHVVASAKHYAANSIERTRHRVDVTIDERALREIYLPHFRMAVRDAHVGSVMTAYNQVNGTYCSENDHLVREILKDEWGFDGFVESDWFAAVQSTAPSAIAGLDIEMPVARLYGAPLVDAVRAGEVSGETIDDAVRRILRVQLCFGLDRDPPDLRPEEVVGSPAHLELAREVAQRGIVLLENEGAALPLPGSARVVVVGALADVANLGDTGSSNVVPTSAVTPLEGIRGRAAETAYVRGDPLSADDASVVAAADAAVVVVGLDARDEGELSVGAGDREGLGLSAAQEDLIRRVGEMNPRTIVVLEGGSAILVESWIDDVDALIMAWYPGQQGGLAIADVLFGDVNPSGRLPVSFARAESDLPEFDDASPEVTYGYFHGYRWLDREGLEPRWPFGFGLAYTTYEYANLALESSRIGRGETLRASVEVTNTGTVPGRETVQLYVGARGSRVERARWDLRDFAQVPLEPGETRTVRLQVPVNDLAFYDVAAGVWEVEAISYEVAVGPDSRELPLRAEVEVTR